MSEEPGTILLAEDNSNDVELTLEAFAECKLANPVIVVPNGAEALDYLHGRGRFAAREDGNPIVLLLDIKMPKIDGLEVLRQVRAASQLKLIPVVMLTSSKEDSDLDKSYRLGANAYVVKPINFQDFVAAVATIGRFWGMVNVPPVGSR
jgi:CheY-like chemotaxis protein